MNKKEQLIDPMQRSDFNKTMLTSGYSYHRLEEDGEVEYAVVINMLFKDGTHRSELVETISEKEYFLYKLGAKKYVPYWKRENGS
jgi:hypothetical protein